MSSMKREDINIEEINKIANKYGYNIRIPDKYRLYISSLSDNSWYETKIYPEENDENYCIERFSISFSGFGCLDLEKENLVFSNLCRAKKCVDELNVYINQH